MNDQTLITSDKKKDSKYAIWFIAIIFGALAGIAGSFLVFGYYFQKQLVAFSGEPQTIVKEVTQLQDNEIVDVVEQSTDSVVSIVVTKDVPQFQELFSPFDLFFGQPESRQRDDDQIFEKKRIGGGTGFFVSEDGMIVTNRHVVADAGADYTVVTYDGTEYPATVLARDSVLDFAILQVEGDGFDAVKIGDSDEIKIGQTVIAIGNSLGRFSHSVSRGIISGVSRDIVAGVGRGQGEELTDIIQTDAAINFGNSGGPLLDLEGNVIGINTAVAQGAENIGFAIPSNQFAKLITDVKENGTILRPFIGVRYIPLTKEIANEINVKYDHGVLVLRGDQLTDFAVMPGSPADKAGIMENDIILEVDGDKITEEMTLAKLITDYSVGDEILLKVWHKGEEKDVPVTLESRNPTTR